MQLQSYLEESWHGLLEMLSCLVAIMLKPFAECNKATLELVAEPIERLDSIIKDHDCQPQCVTMHTMLNLADQVIRENKSTYQSSKQCDKNLKNVGYLVLAYQGDKAKSYLESLNFLNQNKSVLCKGSQWAEEEYTLINQVNHPLVDGR